MSRLTGDALTERVVEVLAEESVAELGWWWLSFADPERPRGSQFLGVAIVQARGIASAGIEAWRLGINPGGEISAIPIPPEHVPSAVFCGRLLSRDEAESL